MIIKRGLSFLCITLFIFIACAPKQSLFLSEEVNKNSSTSSFSVIPFNQNWTPDATLKTMYSQEIDMFFQALPPSFSTNTPNKVNILKPELELNQSDFKEETLSRDNLKLNINFPSDTLLKASDDRYVYFLEGYKFQLIKKAGDRVSFAYQQSESKLALQFETEYYLYDKSKAEIIAWGKVSDESEVFGRPGFIDYLNVLTKVSKQMIEESPFLIN
ncbi:MAG: hypothetical protein JJ971_12150 [Balneolaceae bacterium]|nr:hypothetical protein [Balneolaceae bacterium]MBO6547397.1 hypothetical protein [Balneolaceae bacterium]MBO6647656.1 hypothetical protein [Balneolaceae bacterium]